MHATTPKIKARNLLNSNRYSNRSHDGNSYSLLDLKNNGVSVLIGKLEKISGPGCYRLMVIGPNGACRDSNPAVSRLRGSHAE